MGKGSLAGGGYIVRWQIGIKEERNAGLETGKELGDLKGSESIFGNLAKTFESVVMLALLQVIVFVVKNLYLESVSNLIHRVFFDLRYRPRSIKINTPRSFQNDLSRSSKSSFNLIQFAEKGQFLVIPKDLMAHALELNNGLTNLAMI